MTENQINLLVFALYVCGIWVTYFIISYRKSNDRDLDFVVSIFFPMFFVAIPAYYFFRTAKQIADKLKGSNDDSH